MEDTKMSKMFPHRSEQSRSFSLTNSSRIEGGSGDAGYPRFTEFHPPTPPNLRTPRTSLTSFKPGSFSTPKGRKTHSETTICVSNKPFGPTPWPLPSTKSEDGLNCLSPPQLSKSVGDDIPKTNQSQTEEGFPTDSCLEDDNVSLVVQHDDIFIHDRDVDAAAEGDIEELDASQLRSKLESLIQEFSSVQQELDYKNRQLKTAKMQVKALLELEASMASERNMNDSAASEYGTFRTASLLPDNEDSSKMMTTAFLSSFSQQSQMVLREQTAEHGQRDIAINTEEEERIPISILPEQTFVLIREITSRIEVHHVRERVIEGLYISNRFLCGSVAGWGTAYLIRNFGKTALTALGGGLLLVGFASRKGFVQVQWNTVLEELQRRALKQDELMRQQRSLSTVTLDGDEEGDETFNKVEEGWKTEKFQGVKKWIIDHCVAVTGFTGGFIYSMF